MSFLFQLGCVFVVYFTTLGLSPTLESTGIHCFVVNRQGSISESAWRLNKRYIYKTVPAYI